MLIDEPTQTKAAFQLKSGLYNFITLKLLNVDVKALAEQLVTQIAQAPNFFRQASIVIDLQQLAKEREIDLLAIAQALRSQGLHLLGIAHASEEQRLQAHRLGIVVLQHQGLKSNNNPQQPQQLVKANLTNNQDTQPGTKLITIPVRSGQQIYAANGDLVLTASVSNGAEILAEGNIHVYGVLRGRALAGINGNTAARIFCQSLEAELISIAGQFKISEDFAQEYWQAAVEISLQGNCLQIRKL